MNSVSFLTDVRGNPVKHPVKNEDFLNAARDHVFNVKSGDIKVGALLTSLQEQANTYHLPIDVELDCARTLLSATAKPETVPVYPSTRLVSAYIDRCVNAYNERDNQDKTKGLMAPVAIFKAIEFLRIMSPTGQNKTVGRIFDLIVQATTDEKLSPVNAAFWTKETMATLSDNANAQKKIAGVYGEMLCNFAGADPVEATPIVIHLRDAFSGLAGGKEPTVIVPGRFVLGKSSGPGNRPTAVMRGFNDGKHSVTVPGVIAGQEKSNGALVGEVMELTKVLVPQPS